MQLYPTDPLPIDKEDIDKVPYRVGKLFGFVSADKAHKWVIEPEFNEIYAVYKEGAIIKKNNKYGFINNKNQILIQIKNQRLVREQAIFHSLNETIDTLGPKSINLILRNDYYSASGKLLFSEKAHDQQSFSQVDTIAWFKNGFDYRVRTISGKLVNSFTSSNEKKFINVCANNLNFYESQANQTFYSAYDVNDKIVFRLPESDPGFKGIYRLSSNYSELTAEMPNICFATLQVH